MHLMDNAIKNTDNGFIVLGCEVLPKEKTISFWVEDTGIGIEEEYLESVFKRFWKKGEASTQKCRGLGIGLSLCKELLELMDSKLILTSKVGTGSKFSFTVNYN